jgi:hypothetical protein
MHYDDVVMNRLFFKKNFLSAKPPLFSKKNQMKQKALNLVRQNKDREDLFMMNKIYLVEDLAGNVSETITRPDQSLFDMGLVKVKYNPAKHPRITKYMADQLEITVLENGVTSVIKFRDPYIAVAIYGCLPSPPTP